MLAHGWTADGAAVGGPLEPSGANPGSGGQRRQAIEKGYNPALRHLPKTQKSSLDFLHFMFHVAKLVDIEYVATELQIADIFTKPVKVADWSKACQLLHICHSEWLDRSKQGKAT